MEELNLTPSELLHAYLDGELDAGMEPQMFATLNSSPDLQTEMRELIALRRAVRDDAVAFTPPLASTAAIFGTLGFTAPAVIGGAGGFLSGWIGKAWIPALSAALGVAATWAGFTFFGERNEQNQTMNQAQVQQAAQPQFASEQIVRTDTVFVPKETVREVVRVKIVPQEKIVYVNNTPQTAESQMQQPSSREQITKQQTDNSQPTPTLRQLLLASAAKPDNIIEEQTPELLRYAPLIVRRTAGSSLLSPAGTPLADIVNTSQEQMPDYVPESYPKFLLSMRGLSGSSLVNVTAQAESGFGFNNVAVGAMYWFNQSVGVGVEIGREPYAMNFRGVTNNVQVRYDVQPSLLWASGMFQVRMEPFSGLQPFAQLNAGFTTYGPIGRVIAGTYYSPMKQLRLLGGFEYSHLLYTYQNTTYQTPKVGFTYGLLFQF